MFVFQKQIYVQFKYILLYELTHIGDYPKYQFQSVCFVSIFSIAVDRLFFMISVGIRLKNHTIAWRIVINRHHVMKVQQFLFSQ